MRLVAYDARGHGRSDDTSRPGATLAQLGDDLAEVIAGDRSDRPHRSRRPLAGRHDDHGVRPRAPAEFAERVAGLVFISTTAEGHTHTAYGLPPRITRIMRLAETTGAGILARGGSWRVHRYLLARWHPRCAGCSSATGAPPRPVVTSAAVARAQLRSIGASARRSASSSG